MDQTAPLERWEARASGTDSSATSIRTDTSNGVNRD